MSGEEADAPLLAGRYSVGHVIGRGGMAEVRRGHDGRLGRPVAVKLLRPDLAQDPAFQARFRREAQAAAALDAPAVVAVYDTGEDDRGVPWIVMELVDGRTLRDVLQGEGRLLPVRALEVTADICSALDAAHATGMVHRDIKPANVMLTGRGEVKVMDFGIARAAATSSATITQTQTVVGTAAYLSPEQARGEHVDARSDLYSTGCLLYELVTGVPPFVGDSAIAVAYQHVREDPVPPSAYDPTLPRDVDAVVLKAMAKNPANRYQSAREMRQDLLRAVAGEAVHATPLLTSEPAVPRSVVVARRPPPERRRRGAFLLPALALLALATIVGLVVHALLGTRSAELVKPPPVVGLSQRAAGAALNDAGLRVNAARAVFDAAPAGTVLSETPDQHFFVRPGAAVTLTVSRGLERTTVPALVGRSRAEAEAQVAAALLTTGPPVLRAGPIAAGTVLDVLPRPGTVLPVHATVTLVLASGFASVPSVVGQPRTTAVQALTVAGFSVGVREVASAGGRDTVIAQNPAGGLLQLGSTILLDVSVAPAPSAGPSPTATPAPPPPTGSPGPTPATG